uniref:Uncharacterized protein n=1 Tax=Moniliophthora roreri TaxID=221103 RepID=A0A0W0G9C2_MONRR
MIMWFVPSTPTSPSHPPCTQSKRTRKWLIGHILRRFNLSSSSQRQCRTPPKPVHDTTAPPNSDYTYAPLPAIHYDNQHTPAPVYDDDEESIKTLADTYLFNSDPHAEDLSLRRYLSPVHGFGVGGGEGEVVRKVKGIGLGGYLAFSPDLTCYYKSRGSSSGRGRLANFDLGLKREIVSYESQNQNCIKKQKVILG